jgi:hypothetical protein
VLNELHEKDDRPWERPGAFRRDCEPHRGELLNKLGLTAGWFGFFSMGIPPFLLVGLALGVGVWVVAQRDLAEMSRGVRDPAGSKETKAGRAHAIQGVVLGLVAALVYGGTGDSPAVGSPLVRLRRANLSAFWSELWAPPGRHRQLDGLAVPTAAVLRRLPGVAGVEVNVSVTYPTGAVAGAELDRVAYPLPRSRLLAGCWRITLAAP